MPGIFPYSSPVSGFDYFMVNSPMSFPDSENMCGSLGGHLAYYTSLDEQTDVEAYYTSKGYLLEEYHGSYWMGLRADNFPTFKCAAQPSACLQLHRPRHRLQPRLLPAARARSVLSRRCCPRVAGGSTPRRRASGPPPATSTGAPATWAGSPWTRSTSAAWAASA